MKTRNFITLILSIVVNATIFGTLGILALSVPILRENIVYTLPGAIVLSLLISPFVAYLLAPRMRARFWYPEMSKFYRNY